MSDARAAASRRAAELRARIAHADHLYYNLGRPELTDSEYDALFAELTELERAHPELAEPDSPTQRVGAPLARGSEFATRAHLVPMLSIETITKAEKVPEVEQRAREFLGLAADLPLTWTVEPKLDGVSASLLYERGNFVHGLSRGDGSQGEDISRNLKTIRGLPLRLLGDGPFPDRIEVRGEAILTRAAFTRLRDEEATTSETSFRNARNTVAGSLKLLDPSQVAARGIEFVVWGVGVLEGFAAASWSELRTQLERFGFKVTPRFELASSIAEVLAYHAALERERDEFPYEVDGIVAKIDRLDLQRRLGATARTPRWALAYKFAPRRAVTRVLKITSQVGRTGAITPVAELEPVELAGVTVKRATLHNWELLTKKDVRVGDQVEIERAGDVIPEVTTVLADRRQPDSVPAEKPAACPTCGSPLLQEKAFLYCENLECRDQLKGRIVHLASRRALDVEGLGHESVEQLIDAGILAAPEDVFAIAARRERILELRGWGEKKIDALVAGIERAKTPTLARFLHALGIQHVGEATAKTLAAHFGTWRAIAAADLPTLMGTNAQKETGRKEVADVGPAVAESIHRFFRLPGNLRFLERVEAAGLRVQEQTAAPRTGPLSGRTFCFTGGMRAIGREEARKLVEALGAATAPSVTRKVTDVVAGTDAGSKLEKAQKLGLRILSEDEFAALVGRAP